MYGSQKSDPFLTSKWNKTSKVWLNQKRNNKTPYKGNKLSRTFLVYPYWFWIRVFEILTKQPCENLRTGYIYDKESFSNSSGIPMRMHSNEKIPLPRKLCIALELAVCLSCGFKSIGKRDYSSLPFCQSAKLKELTFRISHSFLFKSSSCVKNVVCVFIKKLVFLQKNWSILLQWLNTISTI